MYFVVHFNRVQYLNFLNIFLQNKLFLPQDVQNYRCNIFYSLINIKKMSLLLADI